MNFIDIVEIKRETMSVSEMRQLLGLRRTASYWLANRNCFETVHINGKIRIYKNSFEEWYANQIKYKKTCGPPPGEKLKETSYSVPDIADLLGINEQSIYDRIHSGFLESFLVDGWIRVPKVSFDRWYRSQQKFRTPEDRLRDAEIEADTISMPDMARLLGTHRNNVYSILSSQKECFEFVTVAAQKRVTKESFEKWYCSQSKYHKVMEASVTDIQRDTDSNECAAVSDSEDELIQVQIAPEPGYDKPYYTVDEIQQILGLHKNTAYVLIRKEEFKVIRAGKSLLIPKANFDDWLLQHKNYEQKGEQRVWPLL